MGTLAVFKGIIDVAGIATAGIGAVELATGAAEIAFGVGLAGAGAAISPPAIPSSGASSGSVSGSSPINSNSSSSGDSSPTIIYVTMPSIISPSADDGLRIRQALDQADRTYGAQV